MRLDGWTSGGKRIVLKLSAALIFAPHAFAHADRERPNVEFLAGARGYSVGAYLGERHSLEGGYTGVDESDTRWRHGAFLRLKSFSGYSFYTYAGAEHEMEGEREAAFKDPDQRVTSLLLGIGNQWHWDTLTLGVDWLGITLPVFTEAHRQILSEDEPKRVVTLSRLDGRRIEALRLYVGLAI